MTELHETAYGKLNLTLDVLGKRPDGYHELSSVMTTVSICDTLRIRVGTGEPWRVRCDKTRLAPDEQNLCWRAAQLYFDAAHIEAQGLDILITKQIPPQAGMAGGSADAAATLRALNRHYGCFSEPQLQALALQAGSDVPFCLRGGTALACGRGERLRPLPALPHELTYVLIHPDFSASTPDLFAALDQFGVQVHPDTQGMCAAIEAQTPAMIAQKLCNVFQPLVEQQHPQALAARQALLANGACGACLTGTGSVVFGVFDSLAAAQRAKTALEPDFPRLFTAGSVSD